MGSASEVDPPTCQYRGYRNPPGHENKYGLSPQYWHVFAARLAFVVVFEVNYYHLSYFHRSVTSNLGNLLT